MSPDLGLACIAAVNGFLHLGVEERYLLLGRIRADFHG